MAGVGANDEACSFVSIRNIATLRTQLLTGALLHFLRHGWLVVDVVLGRKSEVFLWLAIMRVGSAVRAKRLTQSGLACRDPPPALPPRDTSSPLSWHFALLILRI